MSQNSYRNSIERCLDDRVYAPAESFIEAETLLEENGHEVNLVKNDKREVNGEEVQVFIYELESTLSHDGIYLFEDEGGSIDYELVYSEDEPAI